MITIDVTDIEELEKDLKTFARKAYPFATRNTLNSAAFETQKLIRGDLDRQFTIRNKFTRQSMQVEQARTLDVGRQAAHVGSTADYMADQEFGAIKSKKGSEGVPIPTAFSSGEGVGATERKRLPKRANTLRNIQLRKRTAKGKNRKQATVMAVQDAVKSGNRFVFLDLGKSKGIFRVVGGSKTVKRGWPKGAKLRMVYDMSRDSVTIPKDPWLRPAVDVVVGRVPELYRKSLEFQAKRHNLFVSQR